MPKDFKCLIAARVAFTLAVQMQAVALGWRMYALTHDTLHLGLIGLTEAIPALSLALFAGYIVDHSHPLRVYRRVVLGSLVSACLYLLGQWPALHFREPSQVALLYAAAFCTGLARAFSQPAIYAAVPRLVPRERLAQASAISASSMQAARIVGPAAGGLLVGCLGAPQAGLVIFVLLALGGVLLALIAPFTFVPQDRAQRSFLHELTLGARFVFMHPILLPALSLDMLSVLFAGVTALLPVYAGDILHVGADGLGMLRAAPAAGAVLGGLMLAWAPIGRGAGAWLLAAVSGFGLCILGFGLSTSLPAALLFLAMSGLCDSVSMVVRSAAVQLASPPHLRGRISAVNAMFIGSSNELGEFESGVSATFLGTVPTVLLGGGVCLVTVAAVALWAPQLRRLDLSAPAPR